MNNQRADGVRRAIGSVSVCLLLAGACVTEPDESRELGRIDLAPEIYYDPGVPGPAEVPDSVPVGEPFTVRVWTVGDGGGCLREGPTEVSVDGHIAVVTVYDYKRVGPNAFCVGSYAQIMHETSVQFEVSGAALVVVRGQAFRTGEPVELSYPVVVYQ